MCIRDSFEVERPIAERAHLLEGFHAIPVIGKDLTFFINYAWRVTSVSSMVSMMSEDEGGVLRNLTACGDYEGFGCFYTSYFDFVPTTYNHLTDGPGCVDSTHNVFAGAGLEYDQNSSLFLMSFDEETGAMSPMLSATGRNLSTSHYPLHLGCH